MNIEEQLAIIEPVLRDQRWHPETRNDCTCEICQCTDAALAALSEVRSLVAELEAVRDQLSSALSVTHHNVIQARQHAEEAEKQLAEAGATIVELNARVALQVKEVCDGLAVPAASP